MSFAVFGPGTIIITRADVANSTPVNIGFANEFSLDESAEGKELYGQNQYPLDYARGTIKATGKMKSAKVSGIAINAAFHGLSFAAGQLLMAQMEGPVVIPATPYQITVANSAHFDTDLGVINATTGLPMVKVASAPTTGQYSVSAGGVYTFAVADVGQFMAFNYAYTSTTGGQTKIVTNQPIGSNPTFQIDYVTVRNNKSYYIRIYSAASSKLSQSFKLTDYMMPEIDFGIFSNAAGQVYQASYPEIS